jgi:hypothetical protein
VAYGEMAEKWGQKDETAERRRTRRDAEGRTDSTEGDGGNEEEGQKMEAKR